MTCSNQLKISHLWAHAMNTNNVFNLDAFLSMNRNIPLIKFMCPAERVINMSIEYHQNVAASERMISLRKYNSIPMTQAEIILTGNYEGTWWPFEEHPAAVWVTYTVEKTLLDHFWLMMQGAFHWRHVAIHAKLHRFVRFRNRYRSRVQRFFRHIYQFIWQFHSGPGA